MENKDEIFVTRNLNQYTSVTDMVEDRKLTQEIKVLKQEIIESNNYISQKLNLSLASKLFYLEKLRIINGYPKSIDKVYIDLNKVKSLLQYDFNNISFYKVLKEELNIHIVSNEEEIMLVSANEREKELLGDEIQHDVLLTKGRSFLENQEVFEYYEISCVPSFMHFRSISEVNQ